MGVSKLLTTSSIKIYNGQERYAYAYENTSRNMFIEQVDSRQSLKATTIEGQIEGTDYTGQYAPFSGHSWAIEGTGLSVSHSISHYESAQSLSRTHPGYICLLRQDGPDNYVKLGEYQISVTTGGVASNDYSLAFVPISKTRFGILAARKTSGPLYFFIFSCENDALTLLAKNQINSSSYTNALSGDVLEVNGNTARLIMVGVQCTSIYQFYVSICDVDLTTGIVSVVNTQSSGTLGGISYEVGTITRLSDRRYLVVAGVYGDYSGKAVVVTVDEALTSVTFGAGISIDGFKGSMQVVNSLMVYGRDTTANNVLLANPQSGYVASLEITGTVIRVLYTSTLHSLTTCTSIPNSNLYDTNMADVDYARMAMSVIMASPYENYAYKEESYCLNIILDLDPATWNFRILENTDLGIKCGEYDSSVPYIPGTIRFDGLFGLLISAGYRNFEIYRIARTPYFVREKASYECIGLSKRTMEQYTGQYIISME